MREIHEMLGIAVADARKRGAEVDVQLGPAAVVFFEMRAADNGRALGLDVRLFGVALQRPEKTRGVSARKKVLGSDTALLFVARQVDEESVLGRFYPAITTALRDHFRNVDGFHA